MTQDELPINDAASSAESVEYEVIRAGWLSESAEQQGKREWQTAEAQLRAEGYRPVSGVYGLFQCGVMRASIHFMNDTKETNKFSYKKGPRGEKRKIITMIRYRIPEVMISRWADKSQDFGSVVIRRLTK